VTERREPVSPETCTACGERITARNMEMWTGLDLSRAVHAERSEHISVPWKHADDPDYSDEIWFRVRPRRRRGFIRFEREPDGSWVIVRTA
jgi:hypothetical protein